MQVEKGDVTYLEKGLLKIKSFASFLQHFSPSCTWKATCVSCLPLQIQILQGNKQVAAGKVSTQSDKLDVWKRLHTVFLDASLCLSPNLWRMANLTPYDSYLLQFPAVALLETFEHESAPVFMLNPKKNTLLHHLALFSLSCFKVLAAGNFHHRSLEWEWKDQSRAMM